MESELRTKGVFAAWKKGEKEPKTHSKECSNAFEIFTKNIAFSFDRINLKSTNAHKALQEFVDFFVVEKQRKEVLERLPSSKELLIRILDQILQKMPEFSMFLQKIEKLLEKLQDNSDLEQAHKTLFNILIFISNQANPKILEEQSLSKKDYPICYTRSKEHSSHSHYNSKESSPRNKEKEKEPKQIKKEEPQIQEPQEAIQADQEKAEKNAKKQEKEEEKPQEQLEPMQSHAKSKKKKRKVAQRQRKTATEEPEEEEKLKELEEKKEAAFERENQRGAAEIKEETGMRSENGKTETLNKEDSDFETKLEAFCDRLESQIVIKKREVPLITKEALEKLDLTKFEF